jgi:transposase
MLRSGTVNTIREMAVQGKPLRTIARELGVARNTVRKYVRGPAEAQPRKRRPSKLDPYQAQIRQWVTQDHLYSCETMLRRLQAQGYTGRISILKDFVRPLRPPATAAQRPVIRYETKPGEQIQFDWGEFVYEQDGVTRKVFGFTAVLSYSRMRFVTFVKRTDAPTLIRCLQAAFTYFGGLPRAVLTDRMKTVLLDMETGTPHWHPRFQELVNALQISPRVCRSYTPQTKGKVERSVGVVKRDFWPGVQFTDLDDLNRQALTWCDALNARIHRTTHARPIERWAEEGLRPLPSGWHEQGTAQHVSWERDRFGAEERVVSWDGYISYDGVLYGLPSVLALAGRRVQVSAHAGHLGVWHQGQLVLQVAAHPHSGRVVSHPEQFRTILPAAAAHRAHVPVGHQVSAPPVAHRLLAEYDALCGLSGLSGTPRVSEVAS